MVDVGFGGDGPTKPMALTNGSVTRNLGTQEAKLKYENIQQKLWVYKTRNHETDDWKDCCKIQSCIYWPALRPEEGARCEHSVDASSLTIRLFHDPRVPPAVVSYYINNSPQSWFATTVVVVKMILDDEQREDDKQSSNGEQTKEEVVDKEMLSGADLMRNMGGKMQLVKTCATEQERVDVLRDVFWASPDGGGENGHSGERDRIVVVVTFHSSSGVKSTT